jgi:hypothetical protein
MQRMKPLCYACCLLVLSLTSQALAAQQTDLSPLTVGFDVGFVLSSNSESQGDSLLLTPNTQLFQIRSNYRFTRWLGISATLAYSNVNTSDDALVREFSTFQNGEPWSWIRKTHRLPFVIGPELNMRVGQGDLSVAAQFGLVYHQSTVHLKNAYNSYMLRFNPTVNYYNSLSLQYTYWPQKRFGVSIGVQIQDWLSGTYDYADLSTGSYQQLSELDDHVISWVLPQVSPYEFNLFQVGLTYRL